MSTLKPILLRLDQSVSALKKPLATHRELLVEEAIAVFAVVVWLGAMVLLP